MEGKQTTARFSWADFRRATPELARLAEERLERFNFVYVATIRRDGGPRLNPIEAYVVDGELTFNMMWRSLKALDLLRDPRLALHTPVTSRSENEGEFKVLGRAVDVADERLRGAISDRFEAEIGWRPPERSHFFSVDVEAAAYVAYVDGEQQTRRWRRDRGEF